MFALESPMIARLQALTALSGWQARSSAGEVSRRTLPAVEVQCDGVDVTDTRNTAALIGVAWNVCLLAQYSPAAMVEMDDVFAAVVASLHNWTPGTEGGRAWQRLQLQQVRREATEQGLMAYTLTFKTGARYDGQC